MLKIAVKKFVITFLIMTCAVLLFSGVPAHAASSENNEFDLSRKGIRLGVSAGSAQEKIVSELYPDAEIYYFENMDGYNAVALGKIDAYIYEKRQMEVAIEAGREGVKVLDQVVGDNIKIALAISKVTKIEKLKERVDSLITEMQSTGVLDDMYDRWAVKRDYTMPEFEAPADPDFTIIVGTTGIVEPYSFYDKTGLTGYDIELARRIGLALNANVEFQIFDWSSVLAAAETGKIDLIASNLQVTPEREEAVDFSLPLYEIENGIMVKDGVAASGESIFDKIASSFEKTFIRENRYQLFLQGILTTIMITLLSVIFGTFLGFLIYMACRKGNRAANVIAKVFTMLIQGLPVVVLLMILYYIVFAKLNIKGEAVSVVAFTLVFASAVFGMLKTGVGAVDKGQAEAALALGYSDRQAFFKIVLPQALPHFLPAYKAEIVSLLKATAVVGYIAVQDLTKMGDIIRGRTYEAFFPLIAVAIIYFAIAGLLIFLVSKIEVNIDPRKRKKRRILKGVECSS